MDISPVRHTELHVGAHESLNLQNIGRLVGTSPSRSLTPSAHTHHRWEVAVANLPQNIRDDLARNPALAHTDKVFVNYPAGVHGISAIGFLNYVEGGVVPQNLRPFFAEGRTILASERSSVALMLRDAGLYALLGHVASGGNVFDYGRPRAPATPCTPAAEAAKVVGHTAVVQAPIEDTAQRGRATQSMLQLRMSQART